MRGKLLDCPVSDEELKKMTPSQMLAHHNENCEEKDRHTSLKFLLARYHPDKLPDKYKTGNFEAKSQCIVTKYKQMMDGGASSDGKSETEFREDALDGLSAVLSAFLSAYRGEYTLPGEGQGNELQKLNAREVHRLFMKVFKYDAKYRLITLTNLDYKEATAIYAIFQSLSSRVLSTNATALVKEKRRMVEPNAVQFARGGVNELEYSLDSRLAALFGSVISYLQWRLA
jgi:hypothetical protein